MRVCILAVSAFFLATPVPSRAAPADEVQEAALEVADAMARGDADRLSGAISPDFVAIDGRGGVRAASEFLSDMRASPPNTALPNLRRDWTGMKVLEAGNEAVFIERAAWRPLDEAQGRAIHSTLFTQRWRREGDNWRLVELKTSRLPPVPEVIEIASGDVRLKAMVFRPSGAGPFPAIVYAHGNEPDPTDLFETVGPALAARGYLVLAPHRRGSGLSADQGTNLLRRLTEIERQEGVEARSRTAIAELAGPQLDDIAAAVAHAKSLPDVQGSRVFLIGNSFGGILALLGAERGLGLKGAADFAGSALNWDRSPLFRERLTLAAQNARVPVFLAHAANDFSIAPTRELGRVLAAAGRPHRRRSSQHLD